MNTEKDIESALKEFPTIWLDMLQQKWRDTWLDLFKIIWSKMEQPPMHEDSARKAALAWLALYDLAGAVGSGVFKNPDLIMLFPPAIANRFGVKTKNIFDFFTAIPNGGYSQRIYMALYKSIETDYVENKNEVDDVVTAFQMLSSSVVRDSLLKQLMEYNWDNKSLGIA